MNSDIKGLLSVLGLDQEPLAMAYEDERPEGSSPKRCVLPTLEEERAGTADFQSVWANFSCIFKHLWIVRKKGGAAWFDADHAGCMGGAQYLGFREGPLEFIAKYVSTGQPPFMEGEKYVDSSECFKRMFADVDPHPAPRSYCVFRKVSDFSSEPEFVTFFARPEAMGGLHQLCAYLTCDAHVVVSPWGSGCMNMVSWPLNFQRQGLTRAVLGGWDPSMRKFLKTDELFLTVPYVLYEDMLARWDQSFLVTGTWDTVRSKIARSKRAWGED